MGGGDSMAAQRLALIGAGLIGRRHAAAIRTAAGATLASVADPAGEAVAAANGVAWFPTMEALLAAERPDGAIVATPNALHAPQTLACLAAGVPVLVEKPIAIDTAEARAMVDAAEAAGLPLLVGHHRRHNPLIAAAKARIDRGALGRITAVHGMCWLGKPDGYFDVSWRREPGGGPILINLIHDIDLLQFLCGEITEVQALASSAARGFAVEDTAAMLLRFANGAIGTVSLSDTIPAPWSWELTARENPAYPATDESCYWIGGTEGAMALPGGSEWTQPAGRDWMASIQMARSPAAQADPLVAQIENFVAAIRGEAAPIAPGAEGLRTLAVIEAVRASAAANGAAMPVNAPGAAGSARQT